MDSFSVKPNVLEGSASSLSNISNRLNRIAGSVESVRYGLSWEIKAKHQINTNLKQINTSLENLSSKTNKYGKTLGNCAQWYVNSENRILSNAGGKTSETGNENIIYELPKGLIDFLPFIRILPGIFNPGLLVGGLDYLLCLLKGDSGVTGGTKYKWGFLNGDFNTTAEAVWKDGDIKANIGFKADGSIAEGEISGSLGILEGKVKGSVGNAAVSGKLGIGLMEDGKLSPSIKADLKAEVTAAEGSAETHIGDEQSNVHAKAEGSVLGAEAEAKLNVGKITVEKNGVTTSEYGVQAEVGAEAYLAEGTISGGITIFGIDIDASLTGKAGGAGVSAGGSITNSGVEGSIGAGLGLGGGVKIKVDWSDFKWPEFKWPW